jgi:hypothetical protein
MAMAAIAAAALSPAAWAQAQQPPSPPPSPLTAEVTGVLQQMQKTVASAAQFSVQSRSIRAYAGPNGELLHIEHMMKATVRRPDHMRVEVTGDDGANTMVYDGKSLTLFSENQKQYAVLPVTGPIGEALETASQKLAVDLPLADLFSNDPNHSLIGDVLSGGEVGVAKIDGAACKHYFFAVAPDLDMELWLEDTPQALLRRVIVTYRSLPGRPTFIADLSNWDFSTRPDDKLFAFQPPAGATQVQLTARAGSPAAR